MRATPAFQFVSDPDGGLVRAAESVQQNPDDR
jgi:hypothetical protein